MTTNNSIVIRVDGHPRPQPRAKAFVRGGHAAVYNPNTNAGWRECVGIAAKLQRPVTPLGGAIRVDIMFIFPRPKNHFSSGKAGGLARNAPVYFHTIGRGVYGGDRDNCEKTILDVLTQCGFWTDDGLVCCGQIVKRWSDIGERPGCLVVITPVEDKEPSGWLSDLDRKMRRKADSAPAPKTQQVIPDAPAATNPVRQFTDLWVTKWMQKYMSKYPFAGAKDAKCAMRIWDSSGHDLGFAGKLIDEFLADDQEFYQGHTLQMLSAGGVLPKFIARARKAAQPSRGPITTMEMYGKI
jgi:Holliday junction resolvase RusA-like endonuclease